jgi:hypothetical protein
MNAHDGAEATFQATVYSSGALDCLLRDMRTVAQHVLAGPHSYEMVGRLLLGAEPIQVFI